MDHLSVCRRSGHPPAGAIVVRTQPVVDLQVNHEPNSLMPGCQCAERRSAVLDGIFDPPAGSRASTLT
jgi:hypothetical protein